MIFVFFGEGMRFREFFKGFLSLVSELLVEGGGGFGVLM